MRGQARLHQDQPEGALADLQTALRLLAPELARSPAGVADLLEWLGERYAEAALAAGQPVDRSLLGPPDAAEA